MKILVNEPASLSLVTGADLKTGELAELIAVGAPKGEIVMRFGITTIGLVSLSDATRYWTNGGDLAVRRLASGTVVTLTQEGKAIPAPAPVAEDVKFDPLAAQKESRNRIDAILFASDRREVRKLIRDGRVIDAIKYVRTKTNEGLKEAKDYVDHTRATMPAGE